MTDFRLWADPWWVNLAIFVPIFAYILWRNKGGITVTKKQLAILGLWAAAFGYVEAVVVVYLRGAIGLLTGTEIVKQILVLDNLPPRLMMIEITREAATMIMLVSLAWLAAKNRRDWWAVFLWIFAIWDIFYYLGLWATIGWPESLLSMDVLFLIPEPWISQVWFPILVSSLVVIAVLMSVRRRHKE